MTSAPTAPFPEEIFQREQGAALAARTRVALGVAIAIHLVNLPTNDAALVGHPRAAVLRGAMIALCVLGLWLVRRPRGRRDLELAVGPLWMGQLLGLGVMQCLSPDDSLEAWSGVFVFGPMVLSLACGLSPALTTLLVGSGLLSQLGVLLARLGHVSDLPLQLPVLLAIVAAARSRERLARAEIGSRSALAALHAERLRAQREGFVSELHDGPAASVARAAAVLERASREGRDAEALSSARRALADAMVEARALMSDLDAAPSRWSELVADLRRALADACEGAGMTGRLEASTDDDGAPSPELAHALRRAVREATTNAIRHAHATQLVCTLARSGGTVTLEARDDGRGPGEPPRIGRGLSILADRARRLGGDAELARAEGAGSVLRATFREPQAGVEAPTAG